VISQTKALICLTVCGDRWFEEQEIGWFEPAPTVPMIAAAQSGTFHGPLLIGVSSACRT
jgi:hypothetical protein